MRDAIEDAAKAARSGLLAPLVDEINAVAEGIIEAADIGNNDGDNADDD